MRARTIRTATLSLSGIADARAQALADEQLVILCDCKKKELIGGNKNAGRELAPTGKPILEQDRGSFGQPI